MSKRGPSTISTTRSGAGWPGSALHRCMDCDGAKETPPAMRLFARGTLPHRGDLPRSGSCGMPRIGHGVMYSWPEFCCVVALLEHVRARGGGKCNEELSEPFVRCVFGAGRRCRSDEARCPSREAAEKASVPLGLGLCRSSAPGPALILTQDCRHAAVRHDGWPSVRHARGNVTRLQRPVLSATR